MVSNDLHIYYFGKQGNERLPDPCWWVRLGGAKNIYEKYELAQLMT